MYAVEYSEKESWTGALGKAMIKSPVMIDDNFDKDCNGLPMELTHESESMLITGSVQSESSKLTLRRLRVKVTLNEGDSVFESMSMAKERPEVLRKILQDNYTNIQEAFKMLNETDQNALVSHFNEVSDEFGDFMFGVNGIQKAEFTMFMTDYAESELK